MDRYVVVTLTGPDLQELSSISRSLVSQQLAASVNLIPRVDSVYWWDGAINERVESLAIIHTTRANFEAIVDFVNSVHPYEVPQIVQIQMRASEAYEAWISRTVL